jgi:4a-hydroxytetrahydrobiopterin dehydratase
MVDLAQKKCVACEGGMPPLNTVEAEVLLKQLSGWELTSDARVLTKRFTCKDFAEALAFVNDIGRIAESEGHHPDLELGWGKVVVSLTTHAIGGLSENDFIVAAKVDALRVL